MKDVTKVICSVSRALTLHHVAGASRLLLQAHSTTTMVWSIVFHQHFVFDQSEWWCLPLGMSCKHLNLLYRHTNNNTFPPLPRVSREGARERQSERETEREHEDYLVFKK